MNAPLPPHENPELLARALERTPECPPLEELVAAAGEPAAPRRDEILRHAGSCPACGAELELARSFGREDAAESADVDRVVARLRGEAEPGGRVLEFRRERKADGSSRMAVWGRWAAAALVVVGLGLGFQAWRDSRSPELGGPGVTGVVRSGEIELVAPVGEVVGAPREMVWVGVPDAASYRVELLDVAGDPVASIETSAPRVELDEATRAELRARASYGWRVVALDSAGAEVASSATVEFEVAPIEIR